MSIQNLPPVRRIVTANDASGKSYFVADGPTPGILSVPERPGYVVSNLWQTSATPAKLDEPDKAGAIRGTVPPKNGTVLRFIDIPPEAKDPEERRRMAEATKRAIFSDLGNLGHSSRHAAHHTTETIDYAVVIEGEIWALMDEGEKLMKAGDVLIQRGTPHAWSNRSGTICRILFVLIDGVR